MQITADVGKTTKTVQRDPMFIFNELSEFIFVSNLIFWEFLCVKLNILVLSRKISFRENKSA